MLTNYLKRKIYYNISKFPVLHLKSYEKICLKHIEKLILKHNILTIYSKNMNSMLKVVNKFIGHNKYRYKNIAIIDANDTKTIEYEYSQALNISMDNNTLIKMKQWAYHNDSWLFIYKNVQSRHKKGLPQLYVKWQR